MVRKKIEYTKEHFEFLEKELTKRLGFTEITRAMFKKDWERLGIVAPRKVTGKEVSFKYTENHLDVIVHTTYLRDEEKFRDMGTDMAWNLIRQGDDAVYFAKPIKRTGDFIVDILSKAWIAQYRIKHRPHCKECKGYMDVGHNQVTGSYYWICRKSQNHPTLKPQFLGWDKIGPEGKLPEKAEAYAKKMRAKIAKYKAQNLKKGIVRTPARKLRKRWPLTKPENKVIVKT